MALSKTGKNEPPKQTYVLLVEPNETDCRLVKRSLLNATRHFYKVEHVTCLRDARDFLLRNHVDIIISDLELPDMSGVDIVTQLQIAAPTTPILILSGSDNDKVGEEAVKLGAQDYINKAQASDVLLARAVRHAIERERLSREIKRLSLTDELTGLYNRRAFMLLANEQLMLARRTSTDVTLVFADLDGLKKINDTHGHLEGDAAISDAAGILKKSFRETDIIARFGGDEFVVFAVEAKTQSSALIKNRLKSYIEKHNLKSQRPYELNMTIGTSQIPVSNMQSIDQMIQEADRKLYEIKHQRYELQKK